MGKRVKVQKKRDRGRGVVSVFIGPGNQGKEKKRKGILAKIEHANFVTTNFVVTIEIFT